MRIFIDTNVALDLISNRGEFGPDAESVFLIGYFGDADVWMSAKSFTDIFHILRRSIAADQAQEAIAALVRRVHVCSIEQEDIAAALEERWEDFEDCLIWQAAKKVRADYIVTRDVNDFEQSSISVVQPKELLHYMEVEKGLIYEEIRF